MTRTALAVLVVVAGACSGALPASAQGWPIEPHDRPHHLLSTFEYMDYSSTDYYWHRGLDIFAPSVDEPGAPWVIATVDSWIDKNDGLECDPAAFPPLNIGCLGPSANGCWATLRYLGEKHVYGHLECASYDWDFLARWIASSNVTAHQKIGKLQKWDDACSTDGPFKGVHPTHLHLERKDAKTGRLLTPSDLTLPYGTAESPPNITGVWFVGDDSGLSSSAPWSLFAPSSSGTCTGVNGAVDVVVGHESRHRAGEPARPGDNLGVRQVRWKACGGADPDCAWSDALDASSIDAAWVDWDDLVSTTYSRRHPLVSDDLWLCGDNEFYTIATNVIDVGGTLQPDKSGVWKPPSPALPSADTQHVTVTVEVEDFAGASAARLLPVCTRDPASGGVAKLLIRDCESDDGAEPSNPSRCELWTESPDIVVDDGGAATPLSYAILVCMRNVGNASIDPLSTITVTATTRSSATGATFSVRADPTVASLGTRSGGAPSAPGWSPGEERCATLELLATVPAPWRSHDLLEVAVERTDDVANTHAAVSYDNNRAQQKVDFTAPATVVDLSRTDTLPEDMAGGPPQAASVILEMLDRYWERPRKPLLPAGDRRPAWVVQVFVGPGLVFEPPEGGIVLGAMTPETYAAWDGARPLVPGDPELILAGGELAPVNLAGSLDGWRVIEVPPSTPFLRFEVPSLGKRVPVSVRVWPRRVEETPDVAPMFLLRVVSPSKIDGRAVEWFQRRVKPIRGGRVAPTR
ncbi:MAG TPA: hypothetical protein VF139_10640 [Candidatus Polarisedimenticolaceae bacterium]